MTLSSDWSALDSKYVWHPYSAADAKPAPVAVVSAQDVLLKLADGRTLIDGMSSWWCAIHGYNHPRLNQAIQQQTEKMSHIMFGGLTHEPAVKLAKKLVELTPDALQKVFFSDSGSVSVEVAMKMAIQYQHAKNRPEKHRFVALRQGYHGDTFAAMSVCDPVTGMHTLFGGTLAQQFFIDSPACRFEQTASEADMQSLQNILQQHHREIAALILEPVVQGAGGMRFYSASWLRKARILCDRFDVLLIADEIATGFGRTGELFACNHAGITPDILCLGKALTGGYMTLAATLTTDDIATTVSDNPPHVFMHGPTFMANPLACAVANASIELLLESDWQEKVREIEQALVSGLEPCRHLPAVADVRVLGAIGVVELHKPVDMTEIQPLFVEKGVWVRPFGKLVYLMPPFVIDQPKLKILTQAVFDVVSSLH